MANKLHLDITIFSLFQDQEKSTRFFEDKRENKKIDGAILAEHRASTKTECSLHYGTTRVLSSVTIVMLLVATVFLVQVLPANKINTAGQLF